MTTHRVNIENTGDTFLCRDDEVVLTAMIAMGHRGIPVGCRGGGCGVCKVQVTRGDYRCRKMSRMHLSPEEEHDGFALACQTIPKSALSLRVAGSSQQTVLGSKNRTLREYWRTAIPDTANREEAACLMQQRNGHRR